MPTVVGETSGGDPIFEVRSVRLVLRPDATHFSRVAACSKCGREVPGAAVMSPADLDLVPHPFTCKSCVDTAGSPMFETESRHPLTPAPSPPPVTAANGSASGSPAAAPADDARVEALERKLDEAMEKPGASGKLHRSELSATGHDRTAQPHSDAQSEAVEREEWDDVVRRVDHIPDPLMQDPAVRSRLEDLEERVQRLQAIVDAGPDRSGGELVATLDARFGEVRAANEELGRAQDEQRQGLTTVEARIRELQTGLDAGLARVQSDGVTLAQARGDVARLETRLTGRLAGLAAGIVSQRRELVAIIEEGLLRVGEQVQELRTSVDDGAVGAEAGSPALERATEELARLGDQLNERLDRLSERTVRTEPVDNERLRAVERQVEEAAGRLAEALESQRAELQGALTEVRSSIPDPVAIDTERLQALEERVARTAAQISEVDDLLALLDSGFGELRSGIDALRGAETQRITAPAEVTRVLPAVDAQPAVPVGPEPGRRYGKRSEATAQVAAVAEATEQLALRQRQLEAQMATLERISDATVKSVARASSEAAAVAPVRSELKAVRDELWEHDEALGRLARSVESLRRKTPAPAPAPQKAAAAPKRAPAAAKKAPAAKPAPRAKPATRKPKES